MQPKHLKIYANKMTSGDAQTRAAKTSF